MNFLTMDGKTANSSNRSSSKEGEISKMNAMSIYSTKNNYTEATEFISDKTNEIPTDPMLLDRINIKDSIIVFDTLSLQTETIEYIVKHEGHYVASVKGNQKILEECIKEYFNDEDLYKKTDWKNLKSIGLAIRREWEIENKLHWYGFYGGTVIKAF